MCLTVYGTQTLDDLEAMVRGKFGAVPNSNLKPPPISGRRCQIALTHFLQCNATIQVQERGSWTLPVDKIGVPYCVLS